MVRSMVNRREALAGLAAMVASPLALAKGKVPTAQEPGRWCVDVVGWLRKHMFNGFEHIIGLADERKLVFDTKMPCEVWNGPKRKELVNFLLTSRWICNYFTREGNLLLPIEVRIHYDKDFHWEALVQPTQSSINRVAEENDWTWEEWKKNRLGLA